MFIHLWLNTIAIQLYKIYRQKHFLMKLCVLFCLGPDNELQLLYLLSDTGVITKKKQCQYYGGKIHFEKQANTWYWICNRKVQGV